MKARYFKEHDILIAGLKARAKGPYSIAVMYSNEALEAHNVEKFINEYVEFEFPHEDMTLIVIDFDKANQAIGFMMNAAALRHVGFEILKIPAKDKESRKTIETLIENGQKQKNPPIGRNRG